MSELKVLSKEEVDALIKVTQDSHAEVASASTDTEGEKKNAINEKAFKNITELAAAECEKTLTAFLRKKIHSISVKTNNGVLSSCFENKMEKHVYTVFQVMPMKIYGMLAIDYTFLHQVVNLVFGGSIESVEATFQTPGKVGLLIAEKTAAAILDGFVKACGDYGKLGYEIINTIPQPNLTSKLALDQKTYSIDITTKMGTFESVFSIAVQEEFFHTFIPFNTEKTTATTHVESTLWRSAIEKQVIDSYVSVKVNLPEVSMKMSDIMKLKSGDLIPIADPTDVFVLLNDLKLFQASAGQANNKRVIKIVSEV